MSENNKSYIKYLVSQVVVDVTIDLSTVIYLKVRDGYEPEPVTSVYTRIIFSQYKLDIYNKIEIMGGININAKDLIGLQVINYAGSAPYIRTIG